MAKQLFLTVIIVIGFAACNSRTRQDNMKTMDFVSFTIEAPQSWTAIKEKGIDSYIGRIAIDETDTLEFDLGWYSNDLTEYQELKWSDGKTYYISSYDTSYNPTMVDSADKYKVVKSIVLWDKVAGRKAKILAPIKPGVGTTGIYIDSLWQTGVDVDKFNLYGTNLKPENEKSALAAFNTLKFYKKK